MTEKVAEATNELIYNKIAYKITKILRTLPQNSSKKVTNETENIRFDRGR